MSRRSRRRAIGVTSLLIWLVAADTAHAQIVTVAVPPAVSFAVTDISSTTTGTPTPSTVTAVNPIGFLFSTRLVVSVRADAATFTGPGALPSFAAANVSWTASTSSGTAFNGTLSSAAYTQVFRSSTTFLLGSVSVTWLLGTLPATGLRAGTHTLAVRWRFEAM